jgi:GNAT superfamily N-acetyltransferase
VLDDVIISQAARPNDILAVRELWREYWTSFGLADDFQGFRQELEGLPGVYGQPGGVLLVAWSGEQPLGTIALRRLTTTSSEVKRLYLRPQSRGLGLGRRLLEQVIERAAGAGCHQLYADTLPSMKEALSLYQRVGFAVVEPYSITPTPGAIYLRLNLVSI